MADKINFARLHAILAQTKLQQSNNAAYQVINQLIDSVELLADQLEQKINEVASQAPPPSTGGGGGTGPDPSNSVNNLDGTNNPGLSSLYSRGDHKHADANRPTDNEKAALVGTNGSPSATNKFVTNTDPRLSASGTVSPHHTTHEPGGSDAITTLDGSVIKTGTVLAPRLPAVTGLNGFPGGTTTFLRADGTFGTPAAGVPGAHHTTHELGGTDVVQIAESQVTNLVTDLAGKVSTTDPRLTDARTPTVHKTTHQNGGSDAIDIKLLAGYDASTAHFLRGDGVFATLPATIPSAHHTSHEQGGSDQILTLASWLQIKGANKAVAFNDSAAPAGSQNWRILDYGDGQVRIEMLNDANSAVVSTPIQFRWNGTTYFQNTLSSIGGYPGINLNYGQPRLWMTDSSQPADQKMFEFINANGSLLLRSSNDANNAFPGTVTFDRVGNINTSGGIGAVLGVYERNRGTAMGIWNDAAFNPSWFSADGSTWTLDGNFFSHCWMLIGQTLFYTIQVGPAHSSLSAPAQILRIILPFGWATQRQATGTVVTTGQDHGWENGFAYCNSGANTLIIHRTLYQAGTPGQLNTFAAGQLGFYASIVVPVNV